MADLYVKKYNSPLGEIILACDSEGITGLWFSGQEYFPANIFDTHVFSEHTNFDLAICWLDTYFSYRKPDFTPPLHIDTTPFRKAVIEKMLEIPYGETVTYAQLGAMLGREKMSAQAVGGAVGHNPVSIIVPCHRVIGSNGTLTGYAGGLDRKQQLLEIERRQAGRR